MRNYSLALFMLLFWGMNSLGSQGDDLIGLTYKIKSVKCGASSKAGSCVAPDPDGAVFFIDKNALGRGADISEGFRNSLRLSVFIAGGYSGLPPDAMSNFEVERINMVLGASENVRVFAGDPSKEFDSFLKDGVRYASGGHMGEYYESVSGRIRILDSLECKGVMPGELVPSESPRYSKCYSRLVVSSDSDYGWAYTVCPRKYIGSNGKISTPVCQVWSRVKAGLYVEYQINGGMADDGEWIDLDKEVRDYILSIEAKEGKI